MKKFLHYFVKIFFELVLHVFWIFPIRRERITLLNDLGYTYGDNLKYIAEFIIKKELNYEIVFPLKDPVSFIKFYNNLKIIVTPKYASVSFFYYVLTSSVIITNGGGISFLPIRKKQKVLSTWHGGGPYKKTGIDVYADKWYIKEMTLHAKKISVIMSSCVYCSNEEFPAQMISHDKILNVGMPRNDIFFDENPYIKEKVHSYFSIQDSEKIVLYAPTYRSNLQDRVTGAFIPFNIELDTKRLINSLNTKFGGKWRLMIRLHPKLKNVDLDNASILNATNYPDIQELLYTSDVCITDYSSLMWDFSLSYKPCFVYATDIDQYEQERGFYMPSNRWPFPIARDDNELEKNIMSFNYEVYINAVIKHHLEAGSFEKGIACKELVKIIDNHINKYIGVC